VTRLLSAALCGLAYAHLSLVADRVSSAQRTPLPPRIRVQLIEHGAPTIKEIALEEYVSAAAVSEFAPPAGEMDLVEKMLEIQTIIGRTYAISHLGRHAREGFDLCSTTHCQLFEPGRLRTSRWAAAAVEAANRTEGQVLRYADQPAEALFHADCGGHTSSASEVWGGPDRAYLVARPDRGLAKQAHVRWEYRVARTALAKVLQSDPRTSIDGPLTRIAITRRDDAGRAERIEIRARKLKREVRGEDFREVLTRAFGARAVRSTWFDVKNVGTDVTFTGRGFGHGVGLCQAGALARLAAGTKPKDVIAFYYPGTIVN
jgi:stage II sporulation protein D (peptidoglycan lytic transglycosylase)